MLRGSAAQAPRPASLAGKGGRAGACHDARGCVVANWPTRCSGALVKLQSQFRLRLFGAETASPHSQAVQHETGHEVRITINRIVSTPAHVPTCSDCDIRTAKSPSNVIGRKHLPSVTKIPQGNCKLGFEGKAQGIPPP